MILHYLSAILAQGTAPSGGAEAGRGSPILFGGYIVIFIAMFYFVAIRPQQKRTKELNNLLKSLKPGDKVVTGSGIIGTVVSVKEKSVALRSAETKLEVLKSTISEITERAGGENPESKASAS